MFFILALFWFSPDVHVFNHNPQPGPPVNRGARPSPASQSWMMA